MGTSQSTSKPTRDVLRDTIEANKENFSDPVATPPVSLRTNAKVIKSVKSPASVSENIVRITNEADPLGFLAKVINGEPIPTSIITRGEDGELEITTEYETPTLAQRIKVAQFLGNKVAPNINAHAHKHEIGGTEGSTTTERNLLSIVESAARKAE